MMFVHKYKGSSEFAGISKPNPWWGADSHAPGGVYLINHADDSLIYTIKEKPGWDTLLFLATSSSIYQQLSNARSRMLS